MKILFTITFLAINFMAHSQSIIIDYEYKAIHDDGSNFKKEYKLYDNSQYSTYVWDVTNFRLDSVVINMKDDKGNAMESIKLPPKAMETKGNQVEQFLDKANRTLLEKRSIFSKTRIIKEELPLMEWTLTDKDTIYLNFPCKIATTEFRGNFWTVFFTDSLGFNAAPWKLQGLPGTVLYATTPDEKFTIKATGISVEQNSIEIKNPFEGEKTYSWEDYKDENRKAYKRYYKSMKSQTSNDYLKIKFSKGLEDLELKDFE